MLTRRLLSGGTWALVGKLGVALSQLTVNALLARLLSPQDLGAYFLAFSLVSFGAILGSLGLTQAGIRFVAESMGLNEYGRVRRLVNLTLRIGISGALVVGLSYLLFGEELGRIVFQAPALVGVTGLVAGWMAVASVQGLLSEIFRGFHDIRLATILGGSVTGGGLLAGSLMVLGVGVLYLLEDESTLQPILLLVLFCSFVTTLLSGWLLRRKLSSLPEKELHNRASPSEMLHVALPLLTTSLVLIAITQVDLWIVGAFRSQQEVAVYGAVSRMVLLVAIPLRIINVVVPPLIAEMYSQGKRQILERTLRSTAAVAGAPASIVLLGFIFLGAPLLGIVYGDYYRDGATVLALLSLGQLVSVLTGSCGVVLAMTGRQNILMATTVVCGAATVIVGLTVVDQYGATGVAAAVAGGVALQNTLMWLEAKVIVGIWTHVGLAKLPELIRAAIKGDF